MSDLVEWTCGQCGAVQAMERETNRVLRQSCATFYCVHGHARAYAQGKSREAILRDELDAERRRRQSAEQNVEFYAQQEKRAAASARAYKGQATRLRNRAKAGVCPCCKRSFKQLAAHMAKKHPDFSRNPDADLPKDVPPILSVVEGGKS